MQSRASTAVALVSYYNTGHRIKNPQGAAGVEPTCSAVVGLLLCFVLGLQSLYYQVHLNERPRVLRPRSTWSSCPLAS
ncbi:uncharacterized protein YsxB (DUF464 family) [Rhodococcus sp. UYP5]